MSVHGLRKVLILDWDVHHGNGIQHMFYHTSNVLYISIHRYDHAFFFPCSEDAAADRVGEGDGTGYNINIPWNTKKCGDLEYFLAFTSVILPVAYEYAPDLILVSAGFDAARGDPLGGYQVSPEMYGHMTHQLSALAEGRLVVALEGGYNLSSISESMYMCGRALRGDPLPALDLEAPLRPGVVDTLREVLEVQAQHWTSLEGADLPVPDNLNDLSEVGGEQAACDSDEMEKSGGREELNLSVQRSVLVQQQSPIAQSNNSQ